MNSVIALFHVNVHISVIFTGASSPESTVKWFAVLFGNWVGGGERSQINYILVFDNLSYITNEMRTGNVVTSCFLRKTT